MRVADMVRFSFASTAARVGVYLVVFAGIAVMGMESLRGSSRQLMLGPWGVELTLPVCVLALLVVALPCLVMGLLELGVLAQDEGGTLLDVPAALFAPALCVMLACALPGLPGSTVLKEVTLVAMAVACASVVALLFERLASNSRRKRARGHIDQGLYAAFGGALFLFAVVVPPVGVGACDYSTPVPPLADGAAAQQALSDAQLWDETSWEAMDAHGKMERLATVVAAECVRLNVRDIPTFEAYYLRDEIASRYESMNNAVVMNLRYLDGDFASSFGDVCHECAHAFQMACLVDASVAQGSEWPWEVDPQTLGRWRSERTDYADGLDNYVAYLVQDVELSADAWANHERSAFKPKASMLAYAHG